MKSLYKRSCLLILLVAVSITAFGQIEKANLSVLYVGTNPDKPLSKRDKAYAMDTVRVVEMQKEKALDFEALLNQYLIDENL